MTVIATVFPGATYSSSTGAFTIPYTALNASLTNAMTPEDSAEKLVYGMLQTVFEKQLSGEIDQTNLSFETTRSSSYGSWEVTRSSFSGNLPLVNFLTTFVFSTVPVEDGDNIK